MHFKGKVDSSGAQYVKNLFCLSIISKNTLSPETQRQGKVKILTVLNSIFLYSSHDKQCIQLNANE